MTLTLTEENTMTDFDLGDVPNLDDLPSATSQSWEDGWYKGTIRQTRSFTDRNGNDRTFESSDTPALTSGRNIRLQVELKRQSDGRTMHQTLLINYRPEDYTQATVDAIKANPEDSNLRRAFLALSRLKQLGQIAGQRQLQRNGEGGFVLTPLFGKTGYFRLGQQKDSEFKEIKSFYAEPPKKSPVL